MKIFLSLKMKNFEKQFDKLIDEIYKTFPLEFKSKCQESVYGIMDLDLSQYSLPFLEIKSMIINYINSIKIFKLGNEYGNLSYENVFNQTRLHGIKLINEIMNISNQYENGKQFCTFTE